MLALSLAGGELLLAAFFFVCLIACAACDMRSRIIPNKLVAAIVCLWAIRLAAFAAVGHSGWTEFGLSSLGAAALLCVSLLVAAMAYESAAGVSALGGGDIKLLTAAALFLGPSKVISLVFLASLLGILVALAYRAKGQKTFPFGPAIALASVVAYLF